MRQLVAPLQGKVKVLPLTGAREYLAYFLMMAGIFVGIALLDNLLARWEVSAPYHLIILLVVVLLTGSLTVWMLHQKLLSNTTAWEKAFIIIGANLLGVLFFILASREARFGEMNSVYLWAYLPALLLFSFPWILYRAVLAIAGVPRLRYAPFVFESLKDILAEYRFAEDNSRGIRWVFLDDFFELDASGNYTVRTHVPLDIRNIQLGLLFKGMLSLHNHNLLPQRPIHFHEKDKFYGWEFSKRPYWFWPSRDVALDPYRTIKRNRVRFWRVSEEERSRSTENLTQKFRASTIYVTRTKQIES